MKSLPKSVFASPLSTRMTAASAFPGFLPSTNVSFDSTIAGDKRSLAFICTQRPAVASYFPSTPYDSAASCP